VVETSMVLSRRRKHKYRRGERKILRMDWIGVKIRYDVMG
jgi:hypothetical protein